MARKRRSYTQPDLIIKSDSIITTLQINEVIKNVNKYQTTNHFTDSNLFTPETSEEIRQDFYNPVLKRQVVKNEKKNNYYSVDRGVSTRIAGFGNVPFTDIVHDNKPLLSCKRNESIRRNNALKAQKSGKSINRQSTRKFKRCQ